MNIGQMLALGVGAWFLYQYVYGSGTGVGSDTSEDGSTGGNSTASTPAEINAAIKAAGEADASAVQGKLNFWQWNFHYSAITGKSGPDPFALTDFAGTGMDYVQALKMPFETWKGYVNQLGAGLGGIFASDWYALRGRGTGRGVQTPTFFEGANKRFIQ